MCWCQSKSMSAWQLLLPIAYTGATVLNILFLIRNWDNFVTEDEVVLKQLSILSFLILVVFVIILTIVLTYNTINNLFLKVLFVFLGLFNMVRVYIYMYERFGVFGLRLRTIQNKFAITNYCVEFFHSIFNHFVQLIVQYTFIKMHLYINNKPPNNDTITYHEISLDQATLYTSFIFTVISCLIVMIKTCTVSCLQENDEIRQLFFMQYCCTFYCLCDCCDCEEFDCDDGVKQFQEDSQLSGNWRNIQDWTTDYE